LLLFCKDVKQKSHVITIHLFTAISFLVVKDRSVMAKHVLAL